MSIISEAFENMEGLVSARVALEAAGIKDQTEEEVVIYAKIGNPEGLKQASYIEQHIQAEIKSPIGKIRVRKISRNGRSPVFEMTTKKPISVGTISRDREQTKTINEELYNMFMEICPVFMSKTRYVFKAEQLRIKRGDLEASIKTNDLKFEVDVFTKQDGSISEWCKIDLEIDKIKEIMEKNNVQVKDIKLIASISKLPFEPDYTVVDTKDNKDPDKKELISGLYKYEFLIQRDTK